MTLDEAIGKMKAIAENDDWEEAHVDADGLLCEFLSDLGYKELVEVYDQVGKWYS